ncbi:helix-turn-helix transcriptional regulator [Actinomadura sp. K4S16]|uniref:helix-turn-helix domain-containing protein n=1 Tax=Actinomadura sp. K4S16 TaxID=1316147 RepID=UPI0011EF3430|nr:helix-turn-helix transcriptional regulator [Actinomadura sp. K4S16]
MILDGDDVYQRRVALRKTQNQLARAIGVSAGHISQLENNNAQLGRDTAVRLETALLTWEDAIPSKNKALGYIVEKLCDMNDQQVAEVLVFVKALRYFD